MSYSAGMLRNRVEILKRVQADGRMGKNSGSVAFESQGCVYAAVDFQRGLKAMREGALDGTDYVIVRMRFTEKINRNSFLYYDGVIYMITEFHREYHDNIIQIKAQETNEKYVLVEPADN